MASPETVIEETPEPSQANNGDAKREISTISFPYQDLDAAIQVAKAVHDLHGSTCEHDQIAAHLNQSPKSSGFRIQLGSAKVFGLVTLASGNVVLTPLGSRICDSLQEKAARSEAFLTVPLYKAVYEKFKGASLPPSNGLEAALVSLGVAQKQKERARQVFQRSAQEAGFFQFGTDRLVMPAIKASTAAPAATPHADEQAPEKKKKDEPDDELPPFIKGLLKKLPAQDSEWPMDARTKWLQAAVHIFDLMYTDSEDGKRSINIDCKKDSAK